MSVRQLWEGTDAAGWAQKLNGRTKLLFLFLFAILMITVDNPRTLFILFTFTLILHLAAKTSIYKWKVMAILLLLGLWGSMFSQALFFAQTPSYTAFRADCSGGRLHRPAYGRTFHLSRGAFCTVRFRLAQCQHAGAGAFGLLDE